MIKTFINTYKVTFAEEANTFIYYLKKIPFLGKKISDNLYSKTNIKITLGVISEVFKFAFGFIGKIIYTYLMIMLPIMLLVKEDVDKITSFLHIFFFLSLVIGSLMDSIIFDVDKTTFNMIKLMRAQSREYYLGQIIYIKNSNLYIFYSSINDDRTTFFKSYNFNVRIYSY
ncbi:hypothetical protein [Clostridium chauvoei]|uniref:Uncharacterized protein n=2 Tax=Clostridium chauvoei TaxID=46867 RepID=S6ERF3_9CLOT|nr:hypothetical protein [Clostridium chauvoei]ATD55123.1 hypothetical protein BTM20_07670 [Clostridium chauvoei]ATD57204.1 hypothetical protein BTM21_05385 [Clostridium chauvoei]MBX7279468.1 hypothetical protein [Clostridium chauvoei]MBX7282446.1 hypothetical protein [Clostridium chauvoei]MBX7285667.1 hypothetical protein [Clostridium chauvoei]